MDDKIKTFIIVTFCIDEYVHTCKIHWAIEKNSFIVVKYNVESLHVKWKIYLFYAYYNSSRRVHDK